MRFKQSVRQEMSLGVKNEHLKSLLSQAKTMWINIHVLNIYSEYKLISEHLRGECDSGTLKKAPAFLIIKVVITLAFLSLAFKSQHRKMLFTARLSTRSTKWG